MSLFEVSPLEIINKRDAEKAAELFDDYFKSHWQDGAKQPSKPRFLSDGDQQYQERLSHDTYKTAQVFMPGRGNDTKSVSFKRIIDSNKETSGRIMTQSMYGMGMVACYDFVIVENKLYGAHSVDDMESDRTVRLLERVAEEHISSPAELQDERDVVRKRLDDPAFSGQLRQRLYALELGIEEEQAEMVDESQLTEKQKADIAKRRDRILDKMLTGDLVPEPKLAETIEDFQNRSPQPITYELFAQNLVNLMGAAIAEPQ